MAKIGLFFGSFNPIHTGHLVIASYMANFTDLDEVWMIVSPHNPLKNKASLANMYDRLEMTHLALGNAERIKASDFEFHLEQPSYTIDTLIHLQERYPKQQFVLIMGSDNLLSLRKWKNYEVILREYEIYVYPRPGYSDKELESHPSIHMTETPLMEISSTFLRNAIKEQKNVQFFLPAEVLLFIEGKGLYRR
ncbi:nicotinate (nicotinamide) nucleotide adenylyltransferase [Olivibacter sitiensis]|uniref:nicotinate (nicotinamide) nucleotide adenylyltransferase n=1 Tax=Olivibacter sitiensis TaxID=376470 RepID=UPI000403366C|nr:nicotinate (nicotinamide) nucleotide adenylyltransferase [Olivibacter sitiensis]